MKSVLRFIKENLIPELAYLLDAMFLQLKPISVIVWVLLCIYFTGERRRHNVLKSYFRRKIVGTKFYNRII